MKLQVICAVLLLASTHAITENDADVWVESAEQKMTEDNSGSPVPTTCQAVAESLTMYGALAFVHNSKAGPFACKQAWNQELARASVWLRGRQVLGYVPTTHSYMLASAWDPMAPTWPSTSLVVPNGLTRMVRVRKVVREECT